MTTRETTIDQLTPGDVVVARNGKPCPFPYIVTGVVRTGVAPGRTFVRVNYLHGGFELPRADYATITASVSA